MKNRLSSVLEQPPKQTRPEDSAVASNLGRGGGAFVLFCARQTQYFLTNNSMQMAAAIAFYSFFSLFPLSILIILTFDFFVNETALQAIELQRALGTFIPVSQETIADAVRRSVDSADITGPLALIGLGWASTAVFATLRKGINTAWNVRTPRPFLRERIIDLSFTAGAGLVFTGLLISNTAIRAFVQTNDPSKVSGLLAGPAYLAVATWLMSFFALVILYRFLPNTKVEVRSVLFGALVASLAFEIAKGAFFYYTRARADVSQIYGEFTSIAVLLGWLYVSAVIILIGGLIASIYARLVEHRVVAPMDIWTFGIAPGMFKVCKHLMKRSWLPKQPKKIPAARSKTEGGSSA